MSVDKFDPLIYVLNNGIPDNEWFERLQLPEISSLIDKIKSTIGNFNQVNSEEDKIILKLLQTTVGIADRLLEHSSKDISDLASPSLVKDLTRTLQKENCFNITKEFNEEKRGKLCSDNGINKIADSNSCPNPSKDQSNPSSDSDFCQDHSLNGLSLSSYNNLIPNHDNSKSFEPQNFYKYKYGSTETVIIPLSSANTSLGIHVIPFIDSSGKENGLKIHAIEPGTQIDNDGRLKVNDRIIEINNQSLGTISFCEAQELFKKALNGSTINLKIIPALNETLKCSSPSSLSSSSGTSGSSSAKKEFSSNSLGKRKLYKRHHIRLIKCANGLGFSLTTKDNLISQNGSVYIKSISPKGSAFEDGRLKVNDRLMEVNGVDVSNKSHNETVEILRRIPLGNSVDLVVLRSESSPPSPTLPRQLPTEKFNQPTGKSEVLVLRIPLNDTGSAGLGISVKGKTSINKNQASDCGIFIKSIMNGGAASKDGRLKTNDQLISINGISLIGLSNSNAMATLRRAMVTCEGPEAYPDAITLTVKRNCDDSIRSESVASDSAGEEIISGYIRPKENRARSLSESNIDAPNIPLIPAWGSNTSYKSSSINSLSRDKKEINEDRNGLNIDDKKCENSNGSNESIEPIEPIEFQRDGFGRQSISEKKNAAMDARNTDTYRRSKRDREWKKDLNVNNNSNNNDDKHQEDNCNRKKQEKKDGENKKIYMDEYDNDDVNFKKLSSMKPVELTNNNNDNNYTFVNEMNSEQDLNGKSIKVDQPKTGTILSNGSSGLINTDINGPQKPARRPRVISNNQKYYEIQASHNDDIPRRKNESFRVAVDRSYDGNEQDTQIHHGSIIKDDDHKNVTTCVVRAIPAKQASNGLILKDDIYSEFNDNMNQINGCHLNKREPLMLMDERVDWCKNDGSRFERYSGVEDTIDTNELKIKGESNLPFKGHKDENKPRYYNLSCSSEKGSKQNETKYYENGHNKIINELKVSKECHSMNDCRDEQLCESSKKDIRKKGLIRNLLKFGGKKDRDQKEKSPNRLPIDNGQDFHQINRLSNSTNSHYINLDESFIVNPSFTQLKSQLSPQGQLECNIIEVSPSTVSPKGLSLIDSERLLRLRNENIEENIYSRQVRDVANKQKELIHLTSQSCNARKAFERSIYSSSAIGLPMQHTYSINHTRMNQFSSMRLPQARFAYRSMNIPLNTRTRAPIHQTMYNTNNINMYNSYESYQSRDHSSKSIIQI